MPEVPARIQAAPLRLPRRHHLAGGGAKNRGARIETRCLCSIHRTFAHPSAKQSMFNADHIATNIGVMYAGQLVEYGTLEQVFYAKRRHPYVLGLIQAAPSAFARERPQAIAGSVPDLVSIGPGCRFVERCPMREASCESVSPQLSVESEGHWIRCPIVLERGEVTWQTTPSLF